MAQPEHTRSQEAPAVPSSLGCNSLLVCLASWSFQPFPADMFLLVLQLNFMQKKALFPLHLVVLSDPSNFLFPKQRNHFRKELETHGWSLTPSASGCGDGPPVPKGPVRLMVAIPIKQGEAFTSTTVLSGSNWHSQDPRGQIKNPTHSHTMATHTGHPAGSSQLP